MNRFCLPLAILFALAAVLPNHAAADGCRRVVTGHVVTTTYQAPAVTNYVAPVQYHDAHHDTIVVSRAFRVLVDPEYYNYSSVSAEVRAQIYKELYLDKLARERLSADPEPPADPEPAPRAAAAPRPAAKPAAKAAAGAPAVDPKLRTLIAAKCVACHADGANGIDLSANALPGLTREQWGRCVREVSKNRMPKGKPPLPDAEFQLFDAQLEKLEALAKK